MSEKKETSIGEILVVAFFVISMLTAGIKGCNNATKDDPDLDPADYEKLK
jgi:hypothetical protein